MKKQMQSASLLAGVMMLCNCTIPVQAADTAAEAPIVLDYYGTIDGSFNAEALQRLDDKGMFQDIRERLCARYTDAETPYGIYTYHYENGDVTYDHLLHIAPRQNTMRFVLREGAFDETVYNAANNLASEIIAEYDERALPMDIGDNKTFEITIPKQTGAFPAPVGSDKVANELKNALASAGLISAFYPWGETAGYLELEHGYLTAYKAEQIDDWDAVAAWLTAQHPECELVCITENDTEQAQRIGLDSDRYLSSVRPVYAVIVPEETAFAAQFALAAELYEQFGLRANAAPTPKENGAGELVGKNALAVAGDADLSGAVDVKDAVLLARIAVNDTTLTSTEITDQAKKNADVTHDGVVTSEDLTKLLQYLAKQISHTDLENV